VIGPPDVRLRFFGGSDRTSHEAIVANDQLLGRLGDTLSRIQAFRTERMARAERLRGRRRALDAEISSSVDAEVRPDDKKGAKYR
jgi:hypothetical protein